MNIEDPFVNYGIAGALKVFMTNCKEEAAMKSFSLQLVAKLTTDGPYWMKLRTLTCLNGALSSKTFVENVQSNILFDHITENWNCIMCCIYNFDLELRNGNLGQKELCLYEFIRLSKKVVKLILKSKKPEKNDILKDIVNFSRHWNLMMNCKVPVFTKSVLKLLNSLFPYGDLSSLPLDVKVVIKETAENIITSFCHHGFNVIPLGHGCGFTGTSLKENLTVDKTELQLVILLTLKSIAIILSWKQSAVAADVCLKCLLELDVFVKLYKSSSEKKQTHDWVDEMFKDQDDLWVESLVAILDIYNQVVLLSEFDSLPTALQIVINPHRQFLLFIRATDFDESVVIDLLTSPETCFLLYFNRYLKFMCKEWSWFISTVKQMTLEEEENCLNSDKFSKDNDKSGKLSTKNSKHEIPKHDSVEHDICATSCGLTLVGLYDSDSSEEFISPGDQSETSNDCINELSGFSSNNNSCETVDCLQENTDKLVSSESNPTTTTFPESGISVNSNKVNNLQFSHSTCKRCESIVDHQNTSDSGLDEKCNCNVMKKDKVSGSGEMLDLLMSCIVRVRMKVSKLWDSDLFPYNPKPLLANIRKAEELFENDYI
ncbi:LINS1 [Mytilus edulis]|uniref:LINS1 n=1 Tax=Mytilus edulis TaxID=6550 RepID=A0A8S3R8V4_MYTED|nr:LINS1 [Mytilus edulis]